MAGSFVEPERQGSSAQTFGDCMLTFLKHQDGHLSEVSSFEKGEIIRAVAPDSAELGSLGRSLNIPEDCLVAGLDRDERPRIEVEDCCRLLIARIPHHIASSDIPYLGS